MHRRNFIRHSTILSGGFLFRNEIDNFFPDKQISIALIGCGDRGKGLLGIVKQFPSQFNIQAICDVLPFRLEETRKQFPGFAWKEYYDYKKILDDKSIRAVIIATPLHLHHQLALDALASGKDVYLEKTMT